MERSKISLGLQITVLVFICLSLGLNIWDRQRIPEIERLQQINDSLRLVNAQDRLILSFKNDSIAAMDKEIALLKKLTQNASTEIPEPGSIISDDSAFGYYYNVVLPTTDSLYGKLVDRSSP